MQPRDLMRIFLLFCLRFAINFFILYRQQQNGVTAKSQRPGTLVKDKSWYL